MVVASKYKLEKCLANIPCKEFLHPWSDSCLRGNLEMCTSAFLGSLKFYIIMYSVQILFKMRARKKISIKRELLGIIRSLIFASSFASAFTGINCLCRNIFGTFKYDVITHWVPILAGTPIFIENPGRKWINTTAILTGALEGFYRSLLSHSTLKWTKFEETLMFMLLNGLLMYSLRAQKESSEQSESPWFFTPMKIKPTVLSSGQRECPHTDVCTRSLQEEVIRFGSVALIISSAKLVAMNVGKPSRILNQFLKWNNWKLTSFIGAYIGIFKIASCYLCKTRGDSLENTFIAGLLAGVSYSINPNTTFLFSMLIALLKVIGKYTKDKYKLPQLPYAELLFIMSNYWMIQQQIYDRENCPKYLLNMLNFMTSNKAGVISEQFYEVMKEETTDGNQDLIRVKRTY